MNTAIKSYQALFELCQLPEIKNNARDVNEMLGFISAISASPQALELQDWLPYLWRNGLSPSFSDETLATNFASAVIKFYDQCLSDYQDSTSLEIGSHLWLDKNEDITGDGSAFAAGYLSGFEYIEAIWQAQDLVPGSEPEQLLQTTILLLSKMATPNSNDSQMQALFAQLPAMPEIVSSVPLLLSILGHFSMQVSAYD